MQSARTRSTNSPRRPLQPRAFAILAVSLALVAGACAPRADAPGNDRGAEPARIPTPPEFEQAAAAIDAEGLRATVAALAADEMEGRGPGSGGDERARAYLVERLQQLGLEPGGADGAWQQRFDIVGVDSAMPASWTFSTSDGSRLELRRSDEYIATSGVESASAVLDDAELVFVGYGIQAPEFDWDDFGDHDLRGKVLVVLNNDPDWSDDLFAGKTRLYYGRWDYKYESAARQGAAGAIIIHTTPSAGYGWNVVQTSWTGLQFHLPQGDEPHLQVEAWVTEEAARRLFEGAGHNYDELLAGAREREFEPVPLGLTTSLRLDNTVTRTETANVLGRLPGTDPALRDEVVVWSAHHDHLGIGGDGEDRIFNGALDNAAGCAQVLEIAEALAGAPTRRSHLFAFVGAEEQGLLGSEYYATHPTVPPGRLAANINYDGGNIWGRTLDVTYIGFGKSTLDDVVLAGATLQGRTVKPDQFPDRGFFYRSDQFNFAKIGVPAIYLDTGTEFRDRPPEWGKEQIEEWERTVYHQPGDELTDDWSFDGMVEDARLGLFAGLVIGNAETLPAWKPGDEFEAARREALAALREE